MKDVGISIRHYDMCSIVQLTSDKGHCGLCVNPDGRTDQQSLLNALRVLGIIEYDWYELMMDYGAWE